MDSLGEIINLCRLCLVEDRVNIPIFDDPDDNARQISLKINSCLPVKISRNDNLPKKICDGCSEKLDLCYEFRNSSAAAEKKLLSMVGEKANQFDEPPVPQPMLLKEDPELTESIPSESVVEEENDLGEPPVPKPMLVKEEDDAPPAKRPRRSAAIKAQMNILPESDDEAGTADDLNPPEPISKEEDESDYNEDHTEAPDTSIDDAQPGPSGLNQGSADSTLIESEKGAVSDNDISGKTDDELDALLDKGFSVVDADKQVSPQSKRSMTGFRKLRDHKPQDDLYCPKCGQHCKNYDEYDKHILDNLSHQSFGCFQCGKTVESWQDLKTHGESVHGADQFLAAEKAFLTNSQHTGYFCQFCGEKEMSIEQIGNHITNLHFKWVINCSMCQRFCKNPQALFTHFEYVHALINNVDLVCDQCQYHFYDPEIYSLHMSKFHQVEFKSVTYQCILCSDKLKEINEFLRHTHKHGKYTFLSGRNNKKMKDGRPTFVVWSRQCFICSKLHPSRSKLDEHLMKVHFSCNMCPLCNEKVKAQMKLHLKDKHSFSLDNKSSFDDTKDEPATLQVKDSKKSTSSKWAQSDLKAAKICSVCYGLVKRKSFRQHMTVHEDSGTKRFKTQNPVVDTVPDQNQFSNCKNCNLKVVTTFMKWHENIHKKEQHSTSKRDRLTRPRSNPKQSRSSFRSRSPNRRRPDNTRKRSRSRDSRSRPEMKCTECDRRYDTVENLVNHVKAQHFTPAHQQGPFNPFVTGMVPLGGQTLGGGIVPPYGFQNQSPNVENVFSHGFQSFSSHERSDDLIGSNLKRGRDVRRTF